MADPFVSREDLGDYLDRDLSADHKALMCVDAACDTVRTLAEQTFNRVVDETIVTDGTGTEALILPERPVIDVTEVVEDDEALVVDDDYKLNGGGILLRMPTVSENGWSTSTVMGTWKCGRQNISITYSHGYADEDLPRHIRGAALCIAARLFQQSSGVTYESLGAYSRRFQRDALDLTPTERNLVYKRRY